MFIFSYTALDAHMLWVPVITHTLTRQGVYNRNEYGQSNMDIIYHAFMKWLSSSSRASPVA